MTIDRREFIASTILVSVIPAIQLLPWPEPSSALGQGRVTFMIRGWSVEDDRAGTNQVWITINSSWRTAWR